MHLPKISFVVPLYNERDPFQSLIQRLNALLSKIDISIEVIAHFKILK